MWPPNFSQVLDLPSSVVMTAPSPSERPASAYKAAVDHFIQSDSSRCVTPREEEERSRPDVQESQTQLLQQLIGSAKTLTATEDLLNTLRSDRLIASSAPESVRFNAASVSSFKFSRKCSSGKMLSSLCDCMERVIKK